MMISILRAKSSLIDKRVFIGSTSKRLCDEIAPYVKEAYRIVTADTPITKLQKQIRDCDIFLKTGEEKEFSLAESLYMYATALHDCNQLEIRHYSKFLNDCKLEVILGAIETVEVPEISLSTENFYVLGNDGYLRLALRNAGYNVIDKEPSVDSIFATMRTATVFVKVDDICTKSYVYGLEIGFAEGLVEAGRAVMVKDRDVISLIAKTTPQYPDIGGITFSNGESYMNCKHLFAAAAEGKAIGASTNQQSDVC